MIHRLQRSSSSVRPTNCSPLPRRSKATDSAMLRATSMWPCSTMHLYSMCRQHVPRVQTLWQAPLSRVCCDTDSAPEFQAFAASLAAPAPASSAPAAASASTESIQPESTPLVDFLRTQEEQARARRAKKPPKRAPDKKRPEAPEPRKPGLVAMPLAPGMLPAPGAPPPKGRPRSGHARSSASRRAPPPHLRRSA